MRTPPFRYSGPQGLKALALVLGLSPWALAIPAAAQAVDSAGYFNRPIGFEGGQENRPIDASTRDENGNRLVVDGRIQTETSISRSSAYSSLGGGSAASPTAIGNNLTVITQGSWNTVILESEQINNGNQEANVVLNGSLDLD